MAIFQNTPRQNLPAYGLAVSFNSLLVAAVVALMAAQYMAAAEATALGGPSQYLVVVRRAADALLENGRDTYGSQKSGMILSVLDRHTGKPLASLPKAPSGVRRGDRTGPGGSNANLQQDLYRVLHHLSRITGDARYTAASHQALLDFVSITQSPATGFLAWGEHLYWNCVEDRLGDIDPNGTHEPKRKFITFGEVLQSDPARALRYARGLWDHQIADHATGNFSRHAKYALHGPGRNYDFAKEGSYFIDTWSQAYAFSHDAVFREAVTVLAKRYVGKMNVRNLMDFDSTQQPGRINLCWTEWMLSLATECHAAAERMDTETSKLLRELAERQDAGFLDLAHRPDDPSLGFVALAFTDTGQVRPDEPRKTSGYSQLWGLGYGLNTTAMFALLANTRQGQLGSTANGNACRRLVLGAADTYRKVPPDPAQTDIWAGEYGMAVFVELAAFRFTGKSEYLDAARKLGDAAIAVLWNNDSVLPRASTQTDYYDVISYGDTLLLALLALHEHCAGLTPKVPISDLTR